MSEENKVKAVKVVKVKAAPSANKQVTQKPIEKKPVVVNANSQMKTTVKSVKNKETVSQKTTTTTQQVRYENSVEKPAAPIAEKQRLQVYNKWWFWLALAAIVLAMVALLTYGGNGTSLDASSNSAVVTQSAEGADESEGSLSVDENLLTVEVTMPASFFDGETPEEIQADAKEAGFLSCTVNSDGSVTYKMTKGKRVEILREYKKTIDSIIQEYVSGGENAPQSFKNITYNDKVTQFDVRVDRATYENSWFDSMYALGLYIAGGYYQILDGVPNDQVDVKVNFIDDATGEFIESGSYQDMIANGE